MAKNITLGEIEASAILFRSPYNPDHWFVCGRDSMDYIEFLKRYNVGVQQAKKATGVELDGCGRNFYIVCVQDCFDPPVAIVRADTPTEAEEAFTEALDWANIAEPDLKDYDPETLSYSPSGVPYDSEAVIVEELSSEHIRIERD